MALTEMYYSTEGEEVTVVYNGALTTALVSHKLTGLWARGHAKQFIEDDYNQTFGSDLAIARAKARLYHKIEKLLSKGAV